MDQRRTIPTKLKSAKMAGTDEVKLLGTWQSSFAMRAIIALNLKGVKYEYIEEESLYDGKSELLLKSNPVYKKIPVLIHNGKPICESMIIVEYIDEVWSSSDPAILPSDPYDRAIARFWATYIDDTWFPSARRIIRRLQTVEAAEEVAKQMSAGLVLLEAAFEKCSKGKGFFGGDTIGYLDIALGSTLGWLGAFGKISGVNFLEEEKTPMLAAWAERFRSDVAVQRVMPDVDELVEYSKVVQAHYRGAPAK